MKKVLLTVKRFYAPITSEYDSICEAIEEAIQDLDNDQSYPEKIESEGKLIWQQGGNPFTITEELNSLKERYCHA